MKRIAICALCMLFAVFALFGCGKSNDLYRREFYAMDTIIKVTIPVSGHTDEELDKAVNAVINRFEDIASKTTRFCETEDSKSKSEVWNINENAGIAPVKVSDEVFYLIETSIKYGELTEGRFNIAMGAMNDLWGFSSGEYRVPSQYEIEETMKVCRFSDIVINAEEKSVFLKEKGMKLDLGAVAKGYAADESLKVLAEFGFESALIDAGGNIAMLGEKGDGAPWKVGVQDPDDMSQILGVIDASDEHVVSSGDYQRYFEVDGVRYCHIFDGVTGYPVMDTTATTVISDSGIDADILSTIAFILGGDEMRGFCESNEVYNELSWIIVNKSDDENRVQMSESMKLRFVPN